MLSFALLALSLTSPADSSPMAEKPTWHDDYAKAVRAAIDSQKDLFIHFRDDDRHDAALDKAELHDRLARFVCLRIKPDHEFNGKKLLDYPAMREMLGKAGFAVVSLHDKALSTYQEVVSAHPLVKSRYRWAPGYGVSEFKVILDLPEAATLTQRSMIYAIRVHPERPKSVHGECHSAFLGHAERHCHRQSALTNQHHADLVSTSARLGREMGVSLGGMSEVVAESWGRVVGGEHCLEACFSCVDAWRQSPGHWGAVSRAQRYFGYDIAMGSNGTWYATGIFAD